MTMLNYVQKRYPTTGNTIVSQLKDNVFMVTSFHKTENGVKTLSTFIVTDGNILYEYDPEYGELNIYNWVNNDWKYYSWTYSRKEQFTELLENANYEEFYKILTEEF